MKTTNFEISKKLAEIGFDGECSYLWFEKDQAIVFHHGWIHPINEVERINKEAISYIPENSKNYPAYDLETLLDALPKELDKFLGITYLTLNKSNSGINIGYGNDEEYVENLYCWQEENESLADTAGRLLIKLHEARIINFKE